MEAANWSTPDANGRTIGLNIGSPHEPRANPYVTCEVSFQFHYFFMRKLWFADGTAHVTAHASTSATAMPGTPTAASSPLQRPARWCADT